MFSSTLSAAALLLLATAQAIPTISTKGSKFFYSSGAQFFVKGIAYQLSENDPLLDGAQCQRDAQLMKTLGANAIRVYHVSDGNHDDCMKAFADAGIYLFVDLDTFSTYILEDAPQWNVTQRASYEKVMDDFHGYDNTAGFFIGNEVIQDPFHSEAGPFVKAAIRDLKQYRDSKGYRQIPVGYSHADIAQLRPQLQNYLACGSNNTDNVDFFGLNSYEWCGSSSYHVSGYDALTAQIKNYPVPIFMSETGCNTNPPRDFADQAAIFGTDMAPYWSGAIIYEWIQETNAFGLITYGGATTAASSPNAGPTIVTRSGTPTPIVPDFANLKAAWATVSPSSISANAYSPALSNPACPAYTPPTTDGGWAVGGNVLLPTAGQSGSSALLASITAGTAASQATGPSSGAPSPTHTGAASLLENHIMSAGLGLVTVLLGFTLYL